jgi:hypothetical protein
MRLEAEIIGSCPALRELVDANEGDVRPPVRCATFR